MVDGDPGRPEAAGGLAGGGRLARVLHKLLGVFHRWAESGWGGSAVASWGFLQGSVMPGPTDAVLVPLGLADPGRAYRLAAFAILGGVFGGIAAYALGSGALGSIAPQVMEAFGMTGAVEVSRTMMDRWGWLLVAASTVAPLSAKMVSMAAGAFGLNFWQFLLAMVLGRTVRNMTLAAILTRAGPALQLRLDRLVGIDRSSSASKPAVVHVSE